MLDEASRSMKDKNQEISKSSIRSQWCAHFDNLLALLLSLVP
jgi:hypothetical protein